MLQNRSHSVAASRPSSPTGEAGNWDEAHWTLLAQISLVSSDHVSFRVDDLYLKRRDRP